MKPIVDISYWQNPRNIDYDKLAANISGVIIRACYGTRKDAYFETHYAEFTRRGMPVGVYGFITEYMEVGAQVDTFVQACEGKAFPLGYWGDVEAEASAELLTLPTIRKWLELADAKLGVHCGIYTSWWMWQQCANNSIDFGNRPLWVAHYGVNNPRLPNGWTDWVFHQYSSTVIHPGYAYVLDTNRFNGDDAKWANYVASGWSNSTPAPVIEPEPLWSGTVTPAIGLNVRNGHNILSRVLRTLPQGTRVNVYQEYNSWARIGLGEWVATRYLARDAAPSPDVLAIAPLWSGKVLPEIGLNVRSGHSILSRVLRTLPKGTLVEVFEESGTWARIDPFKQEWVAKRYLAPVYPPSPDVLSISPLCQRDYPQKLGTSNTTIADYGCLLTCVTMYANYLREPKSYHTVPEMNEIIKKVNGFVSGNLFRFASLWEAFPEIGADKLIRTPLTPAPLAEIDAVLADGRPVIVETRQNKRTEHWVLIIGKQNGKYVANDPWTGKQVLFEDVYGEPARWIYSIVSYRRR